MFRYVQKISKLFPFGRGNERATLTFDEAKLKRLCGVSDEYWEALHAPYVRCCVYALDVFGDKNSLDVFESSLASSIRKNKGKVSADKKDALICFGVVSVFCSIYLSKISSKFEFYKELDDGSFVNAVLWDCFDGRAPLKVKRREFEVSSSWMCVQCFFSLLSRHGKSWLNNNRVEFEMVLSSCYSLGTDSQLFDLVSPNPFSSVDAVSHQYVDADPHSNSPASSEPEVLKHSSNVEAVMAGLGFEDLDEPDSDLDYLFLEDENENDRDFEGLDEIQELVNSVDDKST